MKSFVICFLFLFSTITFAQVPFVIITSPEENQTITIPAGQSKVDIQVTWTYVIPEDTQYHKFVLKTDLGEFEIPGPAYSKTVEDVPAGSKNWKWNYTIGILIGYYMYLVIMYPSMWF